MRKAFRRAASSIVVAGTLAGGTAALAQTSPYLLSKPATQVPSPVTRTTLPPAAKAPVPVTTRTASPAIPSPNDPNSHLAEMRVEIAWLADPVTFPFALTAHVFGSNLEIHGTVPNEVVRSHVLEIAREHGGLAVVADALRVQPDLHLPPTGAETSQRLAMAASAALKQALPTYASGFEVYARAGGMVALKGPIPSYEEKLLASQRLRTLHGCLAVDNQLEVLAVHLDGKTFVAVSADGTQLAQYDPKAPHKTVPATTVMAQAKPAPVPMTSAPASTQNVAAMTAPMATVAKVSSAPASTSSISRVAYVSSEVPVSKPAPAMFSSTPMPPAPLTIAAPPVSPETMLQQHIQMMCGSAVRDVEILATAHTSYLVRMKVHDVQTGERLGHRILEMPELQPYQVNLEVHIVP
jgi:hypothetical protein